MNPIASQIKELHHVLNQVIHHEDFDHDNSDFIKDYFINRRFLD